MFAFPFCWRSLFPRKATRRRRRWRGHAAAARFSRACSRARSLCRGRHARDGSGLLGVLGTLGCSLSDLLPSPSGHARLLDVTGAAPRSTSRGRLRGRPRCPTGRYHGRSTTAAAAPPSPPPPPQSSHCHCGTIIHAGSLARALARSRACSPARALALARALASRARTSARRSIARCLYTSHPTIIIIIITIITIISDSLLHTPSP